MQLISKSSLLFTFIMDISSKTLEQLKALAYDQMIELSRIQRNIGIIEQEIAKRNEPIKEQKKEVESK